jgi:hypothetical protein
MALILKDRVREQSNTSGTGTFSLSGAVIGYQSFSSAIGNGNTCYYAISNAGVNEWEVGIGTVGAGTLARTTILSSSNAGSIVNFTAGIKDVFVTYPSEKAVYLDAAGALTPGALTLTSFVVSVTTNLNGGTTIGDASGDAFTINSSAVSTPNGLNFDSNTFVIDAANNNVGIGTSSPVSDARLTVSSPTTESHIFFQRSNSGVFDTAIGNNGGSTVFRGGADSSTVAGLTEFMRIDSTGNVGIGTSSPAARLDINTGGSSNTMARFTSNGSYFSYILTSGVTSVFSADTSGNNSFTVRGASNQLECYTNGSERMRIDSSGNLGIGETSPSTFGKLVVKSGTINLVTDTSSQRRISFWSQGNGNSENSYIQVQNDGATTNTGEILFATRNSSATLAERMRIDSSGNLLVGTTSTTNGAKLSVNGVVYMNNTVYVPGVYSLTTGSAANVHIASDGTLYRSTSSLKYKTDVQDATHGLAQVLALRSVTYKGINDGETVFGGLIAEEVDEAGLTEFVQYAEDGSPDALAYGQMVSLAFKAIQEQQAIIQSQADTITAMEARLTALENK